MACLVGKLRQTVPTPTPARRAISSIGALRPDSASRSEAAASTRSRLRRASTRPWRALSWLSMAPSAATVRHNENTLSARPRDQTEARLRFLPPTPDRPGGTVHESDVSDIERLHDK